MAGRLRLSTRPDPGRSQRVSALNWLPGRTRRDSDRDRDRDRDMGQGQRQGPNKQTKGDGRGGWGTDRDARNGDKKGRKRGQEMDDIERQVGRKFKSHTGLPFRIQQLR